MTSKKYVGNPRQIYKVCESIGKNAAIMFANRVHLQCGKYRGVSRCPALVPKCQCFSKHSGASRTHDEISLLGANGPDLATKCSPNAPWTAKACLYGGASMSERREVAIAQIDFCLRADLIWTANGFQNLWTRWTTSEEDGNEQQRASCCICSLSRTSADLCVGTGL